MSISAMTHEEREELARKVKSYADILAAVAKVPKGVLAPGGHMDKQLNRGEIDRELLSAEQREIIPEGWGRRQVDHRADEALECYRLLERGEPIPSSYSEIIEAAKTYGGGASVGRADQ
jgi:hypothetical protein